MRPRQLRRKGSSLLSFGILSPLSKVNRCVQALLTPKWMCLTLIHSKDSKTGMGGKGENKIEMENREAQTRGLTLSRVLVKSGSG